LKDACFSFSVIKCDNQNFTVYIREVATDYAGDNNLCVKLLQKMAESSFICKRWIFFQSSWCETAMQMYSNADILLKRFENGDIQE